jgi:hypothetical protein
MATGADAAEQAVAQLGVLAEELAGWGFAACLTQAGQACLTVASRSEPEFPLKVHVAPADDGTWWFWWSWADRIAPVSEAETAAFKIAYLLFPYADE